MYDEASHGVNIPCYHVTTDHFLSMSNEREQGKEVGQPLLSQEPLHYLINLMSKSNILYYEQIKINSKSLKI